MAHKLLLPRGVRWLAGHRFATSPFAQQTQVSSDLLTQRSPLIGTAQQDPGRRRSIWTDCKPRLSVNPKVSLVDEDLVIEASGLDADHPVTIQAEAESACGSVRFVSKGCYVSDKEGTISTSRDPCLRGTYRGVDHMGPVWSMTAAMTPDVGEPLPSARIKPRDPSRPVTIKFSLLNGHVGHRETRFDVLVDDCEVERRFMTGNISRMTIKIGSVDSTLYVPTDRGSQPLPAILDFRAEEHDEHLPALLASHGFVAMTTKFSVANQTGSNDNIGVECLEGLYGALASNRMVDGERIGVLGRGDGVSMALGLSAHFPHLPIRCLAGINGVTFNTRFGWVLPDRSRAEYYPYYDNVNKRKGVSTPIRLAAQFEPFGVDSVLSSKENLFVPVRDTTVPLLMFAALDNRFLPSQYCMRKLQRQLREAGRENQLELVEYHGAGHLLDPTNVTHIPESIEYLPGVEDCNVAIESESREINTDRARAY
ncbi:acyl-coenzyme A thioesterase 5-like [Diadema antillarum]|uniref:acyl-coenzyme A thioesterase 5-like n=1 Tax=Diadema antillarum TaxID=105358 RepID=UPI003A84B241